MTDVAPPCSTPSISSFLFCPRSFASLIGLVSLSVLLVFCTVRSTVSAAL